MSAAETKADAKVHTAPRCPRCAGRNVSLNLVEWDAVSRDDPANRPLLVENECRDCSISFWTGVGELTQPPEPPTVCPACGEATTINALAQVTCTNERCSEHVLWEVR